ncbi:MAG: HAMP domain-containing protein [Gammaproteobacteria bacterium]|nr:HAMP domain-containing protein [Gammaproteobacteria bacterium]
MSFRLKTTIGIALIEALLLVLLVWTSVNFLRDSTEEELLKRARTAATLFATTSKDAVLSTDLASLEAFVSETLRNPDVIYARVISAEVGILAQGGDADVIARPFIADTKVSEVTDGVLDAVALIEESGIEFGRVEIGISTGEVAAVVKQARREMLSIAGLEMFLVGLFSIVLGSYLTRQLRGLSDGAQRIADGDLDTEITVRSRDELGEVGAAFNTMMARLRTSDKTRNEYQAQLEELNVELESRVQTRTANLAKANEELQAAQKQLLQSEKLASIGQLAAGVAHEINNPMAFVGANMQELSRNLDDVLALLKFYQSCDDLIATDSARQAELTALQSEIEVEYIMEDLPALVGESADGAERVKKIVSALRDFSHGDTGDWQSFDMHRGIESTLSLVRNDLKDKATIHRAFQELPEVECNGSQIQQVIMNLLVNAGQAIEANGNITIRTCVVGESVQVEVADDGAGIAPEHLAKVFDPFFTTKDVGVGSGLGLSISYGIVQSHGGELSVDSELGVGTTFTITLPIAQATQAKVA